MGEYEFREKVVAALGGITGALLAIAMVQALSWIFPTGSSVASSPTEVIVTDWRVYSKPIKVQVVE